MNPLSVENQKKAYTIMDNMLDDHPDWCVQPVDGQPDEFFPHPTDGAYRMRVWLHRRMPHSLYAESVAQNLVGMMNERCPQAQAEVEIIPPTGEDRVKRTNIKFSSVQHMVNGLNALTDNPELKLDVPKFQVEYFNPAKERTAEEVTPATVRMTG